MATAACLMARAGPDMAAACNACPITAIILTQDEAVNIRACLAALAAVEDVIIVDSGSTDRTLEIARATRPDVRIFQHPFKDFGEQRNWALDNAGPFRSWVLFIDADEFCSPELLDEMAGFVVDPGGAVGGFIAGRNFFLGRWLRYSTFYPSYQLRLLNVGHVRYRKEGHGQREIASGRLHYFVQGWRHEALSKGVQQWIARHNQYSSDEVGLIIRLRQEPLRLGELLARDPITRRRALKRLAARLPLRPLARLLYTYVFRLGFLDGKPGLIYCLLRLAHDIHIGAKLAEQRDRVGRTRSRSAHEAASEPVVEERAP